MKEYEIREKWESRRIPNNSIDDKMEKFNLIPIKNRQLEKYINPLESHWDYRYYTALFDVDIDGNRLKDICKNYLEAIQWTSHYYTSGCIDWRWRYKYHYPPLLKDLLTYIPCVDTEF